MSNLKELISLMPANSTLEKHKDGWKTEYIDYEGDWGSWAYFDTPEEALLAMFAFFKKEGYNFKQPTPKPEGGESHE